jgi:hypothetical protein
MAIRCGASSSLGSGAEAYYALDVERREVLELDATFIDDEPLASWVAWTS